MNKIKVSVLTDPMPWGKYFFYEVVKNIYRLIRDSINPNREFFNHPKYKGHFAVTRSLVEGFNKINVNFNYNPRFPSHLGDTVIVLAGVKTLRQAIEFKKSGKIKKLFAGPNIVTFASDNNYLIASPEIDCYILNCKWALNLYINDCPSLKKRTFIWPAGVDTNYWRPNLSVDSNYILIYEKQMKGAVGPISPYVNYLKQKGWKVKVLQYGTFSHSQYLSSLQISCLMIGFVLDESQGIAWAESWAANVPTLIWRNTITQYRGRTYKASTAPYLCKENGLFFNDLKDFKVQFNYWESHQKIFSPRSWVLRNMSDEVCASILYKKLVDHS